MTVWMGIDLGGTNLVAGLLDDHYNLLQKIKRPTDAHLGADHVIGSIASMAAELADRQGIPVSAIQGIGAGIPGFIDPVNGVCRFAGNLKWRDVPVAELIKQRTGVPAFIDNDVRQYTFGEAMAGAGRGFDVVFGVTLGTGIAACLVSNGEIYRGGGFMAGELGHIRMEGESASCGCGMTGCLETIASATGIARIARERLAAGRQSVLAEWSGADGRELNAALVSKAYDAGDELAIEVMTFVGTMLGRGFSYAIPLLSPDVIVIGGGAANAGERILKPVREELARQTLPMYLDRMQIRIAEHIDDAGLIGSAAYAKHRVTSGAQA